MRMIIKASKEARSGATAMIPTTLDSEGGMKWQVRSLRSGGVPTSPVVPGGSAFSTSCRFFRVVLE
ncbi:hypothetical protein D6B98_38620 [Bradyrhizobium sp. LVM 105]|nr:hypothetical protein D6B98_38620 [Bradyrhizobium sp. LVM 105]